MNGLTEVHCHIVPYVDDGAENLEEAMAMLSLQAEQGVTTIVATPHCREGMFTTPDDRIQIQFERLRQMAAEEPGLPALLLGREYYYDSHFEETLRQHKACTMGESDFVLIEFSSRCGVDTIEGAIQLAVACGYHPIIAHAERYPCLQKQPKALSQLRRGGAWVQLNAGSILGEEGWKQKRLCQGWLREGQADLVGSDAHHTGYRAPNLGKAAKYIEKRMGAAYAERLLQENPGCILGAERKQESMQ